jgi:hypothetical protein
LTRTPVDFVDAYFLGTPDGSLELFQMHRIDFDEAAKTYPNDWALADEYKMPAGPSAPKIVDKRDVFSSRNRKPSLRSWRWFRCRKTGFSASWGGSEAILAMMAGR